MGKVYLKDKEERRILAGHLWIFNNEIASIEELKENGELVDIYSWQQKFLGQGYYNRHSLIAVRILSPNRESINPEFFTRQFQRAYQYRKKIYPGSDSYRLIYSEGDLLPGLIVDKYGEYLVVQFLTMGMEKLSDLVLKTLLDLFNPKGILLRNDTATREREGLGQEVKVAFGDVPEMVEIEENGLRFKANLHTGQKTGFFFDQRENRRLLRQFSQDKKVLDCFCYSGGFTLYACQAGAASILSVDQSEEALTLVRANAELNGFANRITIVKANCFEKLRELNQSREKFDLIILDPPAFVKSKEKLGEAMKGYKEINLSAMKLLSYQGVLVTCSCSYQLSSEDLLKTLRSAARDSKKSFRLLNFTSQAPDHPVLLAMPETQYLKCFFLQALD
ncbi:MAG: SAM-dependent methyltransferase [candidate division Zixibacteria bacterium RBG_16_48_11]|nr:MAG: SAM-dependent methyltransferase [candidate division Zixibacteria bacterium RBG_16_48_11]